MDFQVVERREISLLQLWLLQDRLNGDIGTFGLRIEGGEFFSDERLAIRLWQAISPYIKNSAESVFREPLDTGRRPRVDVSFQGWKPGSIEILIVIAVGTYQFFKSYRTFRKGVAAFIQDLKDYGPQVSAHARSLLPVRDDLDPLPPRTPSRSGKTGASRSPK